MDKKQISEIIDNMKNTLDEMNQELITWGILIGITMILALIYYVIEMKNCLEINQMINEYLKALN